MGKEVRGVPEAAEVESVGRYLARQRLLRGISLEDLAVLTRIPRRSLERLEAGAFDRQPDGFARGFVRTVAVALGLDPDEAVLRLMTEPPDDEPASGEGGGWALRPLLAGVVLGLAIGLLALLVWNLRAVVIAPPSKPAPSDIVYRRDAVRMLAASRAEADAAGARTGSVEPPAPEGGAADR
jgi:cytoskeletal protein RodZ